VKITLSYFLNRAANRFPDKVALVCGGRRFTYRQFNDRASRIANALTGLGVKKGDKVALLLYNSAEYLECLFGVNRAGAVSVPVNVRLKPEELKYILGHSDSRVLIYDSDFAGPVSEIKDLVNIEHNIVTGSSGPGINYGELLNNARPAAPHIDIQDDDAATILFTSGTTAGKPKGAVLTNKNHVWSCVTQMVDYELREDDVLITATPIFHTSALHRCFGAVSSGCTNILMKRFSPDLFLELAGKEKATFTVLVPTMFTMIKQAMGPAGFSAAR
jgi:acyl-CoA synthetase (AMP-forming)/AMP-acid ligase II